MSAHTERVVATGHEHVQGTHTSTLELTTDDYLTPAGDCIVGINATKSPSSFSTAFTERCSSSNTTITCTLAVGENSVEITGRGDPRLSFGSDRSLVIRTSQYVDDRTVMIDADTAANDLPRSMIEQLAGGATVRATLAVSED